MIINQSQLSGSRVPGPAPTPPIVAYDALPDISTVPVWKPLQ